MYVQLSMDSYGRMHHITDYISHWWMDQAITLHSSQTQFRVHTSQRSITFTPSTLAVAVPVAPKQKIHIYISEL